MIDAAFSFNASETAMLVSMPHSGLRLTPEVQSGLTDKALLLPDTDWYIPELYSFLAELGVGYISANYSRYVIDLNRPLDDTPLYASKTTGLFPSILFGESPVFKPGRSPSEHHQQYCKEKLWQPYHDKIAQELNRLQNKFGYAILFDAHSIAAQVPMLFDGRLTDFNFGNNNGAASSQGLLEAASGAVPQDVFSSVTNGRFKGGYITRSFGKPEQNIHAIQLELSQTTYLKHSSNSYQIDSNQLASLQAVLKQVIKTLISPGLSE